MFRRQLPLLLLAFVVLFAVLTSFSTAQTDDKWIQIGNGVSGSEQNMPSLSGRLEQVAWAYDNAQGKNIVWAGASHGGLWKSIVNESYELVGWVPLTDNFPAHTLGSFAVRSSNSDDIVLGTGSHWGKGDGIHYTVDGGNTWQDADQPSKPDRVSRIVADRNDGTNETLIAATSDGIWQSYDFGQHWVSRLSGVEATDVVQDAGDPSRWYAGIQHRQIYRSTDSAVSWSSYGTGIEHSKDRISLAACASAPNYLYALVTTARRTLNGVYRSADRGETWVEIYNRNKPIDKDDAPPHVSAIACNPFNPAEIFFGLAQAARITNATDTIKAGHYLKATLIHGVHGDYNYILFSTDGTHLHIASDGGYFYYDIGSDSANSAGNLLGLNNMELGEVFGDLNFILQGGLAASYSNPDVFAAGTQDNNVVRGDISANPAIQLIEGGDGTHVSIMPADASVMAFVGNSQFKRNVSYDGGKTYIPVDFNLTKDKTSPLLIDPTPGLAKPKMFTASEDLNTGYSSVYYNDTLEPASKWLPVGLPLPTPGLLSNVDMTTNSDRYQIVATVQGWDYVYLYSGSRDKPGSLTLSSNISPIAGVIRCGTSVDGRINADRSKHEPNTLYFTTGTGHYTDCATDTEFRWAYVSRNAGSDWKDVTGDIAAVSGNADLIKLIGNPGDKKDFFLATSKGVFRGHQQDDGTVHWADYSEGLRHKEKVDDIVINFDHVSGNPTLYIATRGRGFWRRTIN